MDGTDDWDVRLELNDRYETDHFIFHFGHRSPFSAPGTTRSDLPVAPGPHGVHALADVHKQAAFFEQAWATYQRPSWGFLAPLGCSTGRKSHVYLFHLREGASGRTFPFGKAGEREARIDVRSHWGRPMTSFDLRSAQAAAAHELFHAIQMAYRLPFYWGDPWHWWSEATASHMEDEVFGKNDRNMRHMRTWLGECGRSLDAMGGGHEYGSAIFCKFLARTCGPEIVREVWEQAPTAQRPLDVLRDLVRKRLHVPLASAREPDLFASRFCLGNFFLDDPQVGYRDRWDYATAFRHAPVSQVIEDGRRRKLEGSLDHLAAEYYFLAPRKQQVARLSVTLRVRVGNPATRATPLKVVVAPIASADPLADAVEISPRPTATPGEFRTYRRLSIGAPVWQQGVLLLIANCSWGRDQADNVAYTLETRRT